jgi:hypothetical protein
MLVRLDSTLGLPKSYTFAPHMGKVQSMPLVNHTHLAADEDSRQGSHTSSNVQLAFPPHFYQIYPEIFYIKYWTVSGHSTTVE